MVTVEKVIQLLVKTESDWADHLLKSSFSTEYQIRNDKGLNQKVCQKTFLLIHGFGKRRLEILRKKMPIGAVVPELDRRGKHTNRPQKVSEELHQKVRDHIKSFPVGQSH